MIEPELTAQDLAHLETRGIDEAEARRQLTFLRSRPAPHPIVRPCTLGDGITTIEPEDQPALLALWEEAASSGRLRKFVPASGAATRMFGGLEADAGRPSQAARQVHSERDRFAFAEALAAATEGDGPAATVRALVSPAGLELGRLPKALIPFHAYPLGPRTALVEQLVEAAGYVAAAGRAIDVHFTVTAEHREWIETAIEQARAALEERFGAPLEVGLSLQDPASDTLAIDDDGLPFRSEAGELVLRPSGHGALLGNLQTLSSAGAADRPVVVIKNIDNIQPEHRQPEVILWKRLLIGRLLQLEAEFDALAGRIEAGGVAAAGAAMELAAVLGLEVADSNVLAWATERLNRPTRVCGMVRNTGEPGGGPFWVQGAAGEPTPQIVEAAQVDLEDPAQEAVWRASTHFNPVDLVCSLSDRRSRPYELSAFVDPATAFVSRKESGGRALWALERPGLWNGAMAGWNTIFVEVPAATFAPVKTVLDLLRPEHQPAARD